VAAVVPNSGGVAAVLSLALTANKSLTCAPAEETWRMLMATVPFCCVADSKPRMTPVIEPLIVCADNGPTMYWRKTAVDGLVAVPPALV